MEESRIPPARLGPTIRRLLRRGARNKISRAVAKVRPEDVAVLLRDFTPSEQLATFRILVTDYPQAAVDVLVDLDPQARLTILTELSPEQMSKLLELAPVDDAVFLLDSLPEDLKDEVLKIVDLEDRFLEVQEHLAYEDQSAGRIMDTEYVALSEETTAGEAIAQLRKVAHEVDMITYLYVVDRGNRLLGVSPLRQLLLTDPEKTLGEIMNSSVIKVHTDTDQEEVAQLAARYDLLAIPVTDDNGRLVGIITIDDIIDVFKEEATEDFYKMAGTSDNELVHQDNSLKVAGIRLPWILFNLMGLLMAGYFTSRFEETYRLAAMVGFIPVIMGMAGNIGSQTSTIAVRGLATGHLKVGRAHVRQFLWQQLKVGTVLGIVCASIGAMAALVFAHSLPLTIVVGTSLFATVQLASLNGAMIPVIFQRLGIDPAVASGPLVTTANDVLGILIYFGLSDLLFQMVQL
jgi:magnesium transporter